MILKGNYSFAFLFQIKNEFLSSKKLRINLNVPLKSVEQKDIEGVHRTIDEDRKMVIQAAIVRIMKGRRTLKHTLLIQEVIEQLSSRFKPVVPMIEVNKILLKRPNKIFCFFRNVLIY
jgi:cullin 1